MSTWNEVLYAFDITELRTEATDTLNKALSPLPRADAVKTLIALAALTDTEAQQQGVAEAIAQRLDGALTWNLVHTNRNQDAVRQVLDRAILLRIYSASPEEEAHLIRRGLDEDLRLYGPLLLDAIRRHPIEAHRELASYVIWKDTRPSLIGNNIDFYWRYLRKELEGLLGNHLPLYQESKRSRENNEICDALLALPQGDEISGAYRLAEQTQGNHLGVVAQYLANWVSTQENWEPLMEASNNSADDLSGKVSRIALTYLYSGASPRESAIKLISALEWAIHQDRRMSLACFLSLTEHLAQSNPSLELWQVAPLLKAQITLETRYSLAWRLGIEKEGTLTERGKRIQQALTALEVSLPDPSLPQPAESSLDPASLPRTIESETFEVASLPAPATGVMDNESDPRWKRWTKKFKRS